MVTLKVFGGLVVLHATQAIVPALMSDDNRHDDRRRRREGDAETNRSFRVTDRRLGLTLVSGSARLGFPFVP